MGRELSKPSKGCESGRGTIFGFSGRPTPTETQRPTSVDQGAGPAGVDQDHSGVIVNGRNYEVIKSVCRIEQSLRTVKPHPFSDPQEWKNLKPSQRIEKFFDVSESIVGGTDRLLSGKELKQVGARLENIRKQLLVWIDEARGNKETPGFLPTFDQKPQGKKEYLNRGKILGAKPNDLVSVSELQGVLKQVDYLKQLGDRVLNRYSDIYKLVNNRDWLGVDYLSPGDVRKGVSSEIVSLPGSETGRQKQRAELISRLIERLK